MVMDLRKPGFNPRQQRVLNYDDLGHLELTSMRLVKLSFAPVGEDPVLIEIPLQPNECEDVFDEIAELIQGAVADHVFSIYENGYVRYSRDCTLGSLFPNDTADVDAVRVRDSVILTGNREYKLYTTTVFAKEGDDEVQLFRASKSHVLYRTGMVIGAMSLRASRLQSGPRSAG